MDTLRLLRMLHLLRLHYKECADHDRTGCHLYIAHGWLSGLCVYNRAMSQCHRPSGQLQLSKDGLLIVANEYNLQRHV